MPAKKPIWRTQRINPKTPLRLLAPDDHILVRVDRVPDLSWLRGDVGDLYSERKGGPGIDSEVAARLMLAGFLLGIVHDRRLLREPQINVVIDAVKIDDARLDQPTQFQQMMPVATIAGEPGCVETQDGADLACAWRPQAGRTRAETLFHLLSARDLSSTTVCGSRDRLAVSSAI